MITDHGRDLHMHGLGGERLTHVPRVHSEWNRTLRTSSSVTRYSLLSLGEGGGGGGVVLLHPALCFHLCRRVAVGDGLRRRLRRRSVVLFSLLCSRLSGSIHHSSSRRNNLWQIFNISPKLKIEIGLNVFIVS